MTGQTYQAFKRLPSKVPALWHSITGDERDPGTPISVVGVILIGGAFTLLTVTADLLNPITIR